MKMVAVEDMEALRAGLDRAQDLFYSALDDYSGEELRQEFRTDEYALRAELEHFIEVSNQLADWVSAVLAGKWYVDADDLHPHSPAFAALQSLKSTA